MVMTAEEKIIEQLPGDLRKVAEIIGIEPTLKLAREFRGIWIYVHSLDHLEREIRNNNIKAEFDRITAKGAVTATAAVERFAIKYALTTRQICNILKNEPDEPATTPLLDLIKN